MDGKRIVNVELTCNGVKTLFNWDNVLTAGNLSKKDSSFDNEKRVRIYLQGNLVYYIDETFEEMKKIVLEAGGVKLMNKICVIDFDGTISEFAYPDMGKPKEGVKEALQAIKDMGYEIHILSCRTNVEIHKFPIDRQEEVRHMKEYLEEHEIPYDEVLNKDKPLATWYIDDRGIGFRDNWKDIVEEIKNNEE